MLSGLPGGSGGGGPLPWGGFVFVLIVTSAIGAGLFVMLVYAARLLGL
jgi:hypothetical protein